MSKESFENQNRKKEINIGDQIYLGGIPAEGKRKMAREFEILSVDKREDGTTWVKARFDQYLLKTDEEFESTNDFRRAGFQVDDYSDQDYGYVEGPLEKFLQYGSF